jgi:hypothetical protein
MVTVPKSTVNTGANLDTSSPKGWMEIAEEVAEGGLLRLVASKPVQQAMGRLVSGAADVPVAYLEGWAQRVRSDTLARKQITSAIAGTAKALAAADNDLAKAGLDRWTNKLKVRQRSVDEVATRTIGVLAEEEIPSEAAAPEEDFMRMFEDIAERASSENLADLLARIFAGEIRKPHSVSLGTLQVVTVMDQKIVAALNEIAPFCLDNGWLHMPPSLAQKWDGIFSLLNSVAITTRSASHALKFDDSGRLGCRQGSKGLVFIFAEVDKIWPVRQRRCPYPDRRGAIVDTSIRPRLKD